MNIFYGTYGFDILSVFLLIISLLFNLGGYTRIIGFFLLIVVLFRAFSKNIYKRSQELNKFIAIVNKLLNRFGKSIPYNIPRTSLESIPLAFKQLFTNLKQKTKYKIVKCPNCGQKLRLPRGQKKIIVTCKKCSQEFKMRT